MEDQAIYQPEAPKGPRNLAAPIAAWLRKQGFTATEVEKSIWASVQAHWIGSQGERFELDYAWGSGPLPEGSCRLRVRYAGQLMSEVLFTSQQVRRLREVRLLLLGNVRYANARLLATMPHSATSATPAA